MAAIKSLTLTPYVLAIRYKVSPGFTTYTFSLLGTLPFGILIVSPTVKIVVGRALKSIKSLTLILNLLAIEYKLSPSSTVYVS